MTAGLEEQEKVPQCYHSLHSISFTTYEINVLVDPTATIAHLGPQCPQDYGLGFLVNYTNKKWDEWRKSFEHQSGSVLKLCTRANTNKETNNGVMRIETIVYQYTVGDNTIHVFEEDNLGTKHLMSTKKKRNAPGSRLSGCQAMLNARLLKTECGEMLHITFPLPTAHSGHLLKSLAGMHSYKPLPEVVSRVESLVTNSYLSQVSLKLSPSEWVKKELIPQHIKQGIIEDIPSTYDRHYHPSVQDLRSITKSVINNIRKNMFDQDALDDFLQNECQNNQEFQYFVRKYKICDEDEW